MDNAEYEHIRKLADEKNWDAIEGVARERLKVDEKDGRAWLALAVALDNKGEDWLEAIEMAVFLRPKDKIALFHMARALKALERPREAIAYYRRALAEDPKFVQAMVNLANLYRDVSEMKKAIKWYWDAVKLAPHMVESSHNMGNALVALGEHERGVKMYRMAIEIAEKIGRGDMIETHDALLFASDLMDGTTVEQAQKNRREWCARFADPLPKYTNWPNDRSPERKLRVGYVSGDFRVHSAARSFGAVILNQDRENFEVYCYNNAPAADDGYTNAFRKMADVWRDTNPLTDEAFCELVREDAIDILVDLSGHTGGKRLLSFARKPAPVSFTGWGYANGTGLREIDGFFADEVIVPQDERALYAEEVCYLPCVVSAYWADDFPAVKPLPAAANSGMVTFGSLNRFSKISPGTYGLWARVLKAVPNSRIILKAAELIDPAMRESVLQNFNSHGLEPERVVMVGPTDWYDHMLVYDDIDIALDPFPHGGGVTALEGLMMGVPVVSLLCPSVPGRLSASILTATGLPGWVGRTQDEYVDIAVRRAADLRALAELRAGLRERFQASIGNGRAYCSAVERHYRSFWRRWCRSGAIDKPVEQRVVSAT